MCGFVFSSRSGVDLSGFEAALELIKHRGPDESNIVQTDGYWLGHNRLKILDLQGAKQPMRRTNYIILFNGEIYNYKELRLILEDKGYFFKTNSDTEVALVLFLEFGSKCFGMLRGMFAIAILDTIDHKLHIARDYFGIKPLYYHITESKVCVASEIKSVLSLIDRRTLSKSSLKHYLQHRYVPIDNCIWEAVSKVLPGQYLCFSLIDGVVLNQTKFSEINIQKKKHSITVDVFQKEFEKTIDMHMQADVEVGLALSGGLDSSAIALAASKLGYSNLKCYTVGFEGSYSTNENTFASEVAEEFSFPIEEIFISDEEFINGLRKHVSTLEEPNADLASIPLQKLCDRASKDVKVLISGEGADEVLAGYNLERRYLVWKAFKLLKRMPHTFQSSFIKLKKIDKLLAANYLDMDKSLMENLFLSEPSVSKVFSVEEIKKHFDLLPFEFDQLRCLTPNFDIKSDEQALRFVQHNLSESWLVEDLLMRSDKVSMRSSIEMRVPFLDPSFGQFCMNLPDKYKIRYNRKKFRYENKFILRQYCEKNGLGRIVNRPKQGFSIPVYGWLSGKLKYWVFEQLFNNDAVLKTIIGLEKLQTLYSGLDLTYATDQHKLWNVIILELWFRENPDAII